jgi:hypothetical protein
VNFETGTIILSKSIEHARHGLCVRAPQKREDPTMLRHTDASGCPTEFRFPSSARSLGHANTHVTAAIYAHALPADDQRRLINGGKFLKGKVQ